MEYKKIMQGTCWQKAAREVCWHFDELVCFLYLLVVGDDRAHAVSMVVFSCQANSPHPGNTFVFQITWYWLFWPDCALWTFPNTIFVNFDSMSFGQYPVGHRSQEQAITRERLIIAWLTVAKIVGFEYKKTCLTYVDTEANQISQH